VIGWKTTTFVRDIFRVKGSASEMTYIVSGGALNSTHSLTRVKGFPLQRPDRRVIYCNGFIFCIPNA